MVSIMSRADNRYWPKPAGDARVAEIGVKDGDTTIRLAQHLNNVGAIYLFDYHDRVATVKQRLATAGYHNVQSYGNSYKLFDSYNWSLMKLIECHDRELFDYVYFDGAHTWHHDALAATLCMRLLKVGGYIDIDDYEHRYATSPNAAPGIEPTQPRPRTEDAFTQEQINAKQVKLVVDLIVKEDYRFEEVVPNKVFWKTQR